jgi:hypothetical protein
METDPVSKTLCSAEYQTGDEAQKLSNPECYTPYQNPSEMTNHHIVNFLLLEALLTIQGGPKRIYLFQTDIFNKL